ncbi:unnamed protein product [Lactuca virosa]|uniref:Uncharacterized protein n=1 Tax=Lactuca virosa TaxID=75947 RepID=A0AAU9MWD5_9ASTR|nr:unnamed protein product [Lactuca virosa]
MEVITYSSKLVKPSTPTTKIHRFHNISFTDELAPTINVPLILYYPPPAKGVNNQFENIGDHLKDSISKTLSDFYPLAGRYIRKLSLIDCNDQGIRYVQGKANLRLSEILEPERGLKSNIVNNFLPCEIGEADEVDDPMLSVKVTTFECGGLVIGMCFPHRLSDMGTMCNFINNWATRSKGDYESGKYTPIFNSTLYFPKRGLPELDLRVPRSSVGVKNKVRRFHFKGEAIQDMREKIGFDRNGSRKPSKVQLVVALLWKALVRMDEANNGQSKASFLIQPVGLRDKIDPQLPTNSFGNYWGLAASKLGPGEGDKIEFQDFFKILCNSVKKTAKDCGKILTNGEEGYDVIINPYLESNKNIDDSEVNFYLFTCWCKFSFYEADFGYGKPIWSSTGSLPVQNLVIMLDDHKGDGVEAWVHLDEKRMKELEQDSDIKAYAL